MTPAIVLPFTGQTCPIFIPSREEVEMRGRVSDAGLSSSANPIAANRGMVSSRYGRMHIGFGRPCGQRTAAQGE